MQIYFNIISNSVRRMFLLWMIRAKDYGYASTDAQNHQGEELPHDGAAIFWTLPSSKYCNYVQATFTSKTICFASCVVRKQTQLKFWPS